MLGRFDAHVAPLHPQIVILQLGINDLKTIPLFPERRADIIAECEKNIREIMDRSTRLGAKVIITTIFPAGNVPLERQFVWSRDVPEAIGEVNEFIRSLHSPQVTVMDTFGVLTDSGFPHTAYYQDTLHLNPSGYDALNRLLVTYLQALTGQEE